MTVTVGRYLPGDDLPMAVGEGDEMTSQAGSSQFTVADAFRIAREDQAEQLDQSGKPYIGHIWRVMCRVESDTEKMVAALHDYLEDVESATPQDLLDRGVPVDVVNAVQELTKRDDERGYEGYLRFVRRAAQNPLARKVKRADLEDNTDPARVRLLARNSRALADELRRAAEDYRLAADAEDPSLARELRMVADQFEQRAREHEAKPAALKAKYTAAIRILDEVD